MTAPVSVLWKGTTDITNYIDWNTLDCVSVLTKERGTMKFSMLIKPESSAFIPALSDVIALTDPSGTIFGGTVTEIERTVRGGAGMLIEAAITVTDYGFALDSKLVKTSYVNMDPADIVADLVTRFGPGGFDAVTNVQRGGFLVSSISFNYEQLTKCIEALAKQIGWDWYVDSNKSLHFFFATTQTGSSEYDPAPFNIDDTGGKIDWPSIDIDNTITNLKNSIYVIGGTYKKEFTALNTPDNYTTVGGQVIYQIAYRYTGSFFVTLDGVVQSQGVDQQDDPSMFEVLYNSGGPFLRFTSDPGTGHNLKVYGFAEIPIVAHVQDSASIGTFGEYQDSIIDPQIKTVAEAQERAEAELTEFGHAVYDVKFNTLSTGLRIGQTIMLNSAKFGVTNYPLVIKRIEAVSHTPNALKYQVEAIGSDNVTFTDIMLTLLQQQNGANQVDPSTVLQILLDIEETIQVDDSITVTSTTSPYVYGTARAGFSKYS